MRPPRRETAMDATKSPVFQPQNRGDRHPASSRSTRAQRNRTPDPSQPPQSNMGMSPMSRYNHNLKVLRRRDPSIISIFDQFSHVCVYHHNGKKWEKQGFEGSMFLYERDAYPPYGFYILNRMGMEDYIHRLYPEDDIHAHSSYLMIRSYPDFTAERLNNIQSMDDMLPQKFSDVYVVPNLDALGHNDKGRSQTVGLWMFATDAREPMIDVMLRLHSYIKKNLPYPEEFRYGPGNPPPPNPHPHRSAAYKTSRVDTSPSQSLNGSQSYESTSESESITSSEAIHSSPPDGLSDLDKLFMKLQPPSSASSSVTSVPAQANVISSPSPAIPLVSQSTSTMTVDSLFAALTGNEQSQTSTRTQTQTPIHDRTLSPPVSPTSTNSKATTLLNSIFASATPTNTSTNTVTTNIYSPSPTASSVTHILSQDVLSNLLGLPPSRSASVVSASSTWSSNAPSLLSARSHPSSREGDDEDDGRNDDAESMITSPNHGGKKKRFRQNANGVYSSDSGYSESSTVPDPEAVLANGLPTSGARSGRPLLTQAAENLLGSGQPHVNGWQLHDQGGINGDVTPRPPPLIHPVNGPSSLLRVTSVPKLQGSPHISRGEKVEGRQSVPPVVPPPVELSLSTSTVRGTSSSTYQRQPSGSNSIDAPTAAGTNGSYQRPLVPFSTNSELWPYPPLRPSSSSEFDASGNDNDDEGGDIIELDFEETSALSDMTAFKKAVQKGKEKSRIRDGPITSASCSAGSGVESQGVQDVNGRLKGRRKTKKERDAEKREQIENSWDVPVPVPVPNLPSGIPLGINKARSPTPKKDGPAPVVNGGYQPRKQTVNNTAKSNESAKSVVDPGLVKDTLISTLLAHPQRPGSLERNAFVREVLTLIHTDKTFVDTLWKEYMNTLDA